MSAATMDDTGTGIGAGGDAGEGAMGAPSAHMQPLASEGSPKSNGQNNFEPDTAPADDDQPQIETMMMMADQSRHRADGEVQARPEDSLNDSGGSSIGYGLPPRGSVGSGGGGSGRGGPRGSNFADDADEDTSHGHRGRDRLSGSASIGGGSKGGFGIDESLLVSPILTDYFARAGADGKKSRPRTDEKEGKKSPEEGEGERASINLEENLLDQASMKNDMAKELNLSDAAAGQEKEEKKDGDGDVDTVMPTKHNGPTAAAGINLGQQLQLDTSMCPSLGLGSAGSDVDVENNESHTEGGATNEATLMAIPETIGIEVDGTFETTENVEMQVKDMNDESSMVSKPDLGLPSINQKEDVEEGVTGTSDMTAASTEPVIEQMENEDVPEEEAEESFVSEKAGLPEPESSPVIPTAEDIFDFNEFHKDAARNNDESLELNDTRTDDQANQAASDEPVSEEADGLLSENNKMAGLPTFDEPLKCSLSPILRPRSTSPLTERASGIFEDASAKGANESLDASTMEEKKEEKEDANASVPAQEAPAEAFVYQEPSPSLDKDEMNQQESHLVAEEEEGGEDSPSQFAPAATTSNDDSLGALLSPPLAQPSTASDKAMALAGPSPGNDLTSAKKKLGASSHALVERLRGAAQKRKQLVTKSRDSFVAKEQKQKLSLENIALSSHAEEEEYEEEIQPVASGLNRPVATEKRHFDGINPVKPFKARPLPATTGDFGHGGQTGVPKVAKRSPTVPSSPLLGDRRRRKEGEVGESKAYQRVKEEERRRREAQKPSPSTAVASRKPSLQENEPIVQFKARPLPATTGELGQGGQIGVPRVAKRSPTVPSSPLLGFRRSSTSANKPSKVYQAVAKEAKASMTVSSSQRPRNESSVSSVKPSALRAQPFDRLLSGSEASRVKGAALQEKKERQEAEAQSRSNFRARPLPATTAPSLSSSTPSPNLLGLDSMSSQHKRSDSGSAKVPRPGEENSTTTNEMQPSAESPTKKQRTESSASSFPDRLHSTIRARKRAEYEEQRKAHDQERQQQEAQQRKQVIRQTNRELDDLLPQLK